MATEGYLMLTGSGMVVTGNPATQAYAELLRDSRSEETRRAYERDLRDFFRSCGYEDATPAAVQALCSLGSGDLAITLNGYKANLRDRKLSDATANRRLSAVRSLLRMARRLGANCPDPAGLVKSEKVTPYRDTRGAQMSEAVRLVAACDRATLRGKRDYALLLLLCENALRRAEAITCTVGDFDAPGLRLYITGKGKGRERTPVTLSPVAVDALCDYLEARGGPAADAPLLCTCARFVKGEQALTGRGVHHLVNQLGQKVLGRELHPHELRHMAITAYLDATQGDVRGAQRLSRHASLLTLQKYDDNRADLQGAATNLLSTLLKG